MGVCVHSAGIQDRDGAKLVAQKVRQETHPEIKKVLVDAGYSGEKLAKWFEKELGWEVEVVRRARQEQWTEDGQEAQRSSGFVIQKWRWIVERSFGNLGRWRRLSKDYEASPESEESIILAVSCFQMLRSLAP